MCPAGSRERSWGWMGLLSLFQPRKCEMLAFCAGAHAHLEKGEQEFHIERGRETKTDLVSRVRTKNSSSINGSRVMSPASSTAEVVGVGFTSSNQERLKSQCTLVLFGCFLQPSSTSALFKSGIIVQLIVPLLTPCPPPPPHRCAVHPSLVIFSAGLCSLWFQLN